MSTMKSHIIRCSVLVVSLVVLTFSVSYAYFSMDVTTSGNVSSTVYSGNMQIDFTSTDSINVQNLNLTKAADVDTKAPQTTFTVKQKEGATGTAQYYVYLVGLEISESLKNSADFKWKLTKDGDSKSYSGTFSSASATTNGTLLLTSEVQSLATTATDSWTLRIWIEETSADQSSLYNAQFSGKVRVVATV